MEDVILNNNGNAFSSSFSTAKISRVFEWQLIRLYRPTHKILSHRKSKIRNAMYLYSGKRGQESAKENKWIIEICVQKPLSENPANSHVEK